MTEDQIEQLSALRAERKAIVNALRVAVAEASLLRHVGPGRGDLIELMTPIVADRLDVRTGADGRMQIAVLDSKSRVRTKVVNAKVVSFEPADLVDELKKHPQLASSFAADADAPDMRKNLTAFMAWGKKRAAPALPPLTGDERSRLRAANPWRKPTQNLTQQMRVEKLDLKFANELKAEAV
jgi:hypothetical protein